MNAERLADQTFKLFGAVDCHFVKHTANGVENHNLFSSPPAKSIIGKMPFLLLLVDDDESFPLILPIKAKKVGLPFSIRLMGDGEQAIKYLSGEGEYADRTAHPFPNAMLLDLKTPRVTASRYWNETRSIRS